MIKTIIRALGACLLMAAAVATAEPVDIKKLNKTKWLQLETENFVVVTDAGQKKALEMAEELERFRHFMSVILPYKQLPLAQKVPVILAKKDSTYRSLGIRKEYVGVFASNGQGDFAIFANAKGFRSAAKAKGNWGRTVVLHELVHLIMDNAELSFATPPWFTEGIAEYFGTYRETDDTIILGDMTVLQNRFYDTMNNLGRQKGVDSKELFQTTKKRLNLGNETDKDDDKFVREFYAHSLAVVHYLNSDPALRKQLYKYLILIGKDFPIESSFEFAFEMDFAEFDRRVDDYIEGRYLMARTFQKGGGNGVQFPEVRYTVNTLSQQQALGFLVSNIAKLSVKMLGEGNRDAMYRDLAVLYPELAPVMPH